MKGDAIPDSDHVARYCKPSTIEDGEIMATAFQIRLGEESLSVNWLEYLECSNRSEEITMIRNAYSKKLKVTSNAKIAVLNIGNTREKVMSGSDDQRNLEFKHDPSRQDPSHSGIYNINHEDELISELILSAIEKNNIYPAKA